VQDEFLAHVRGEPRHLHGATRPRDVRLRRNVLGRRRHVVQGGHPFMQRVPQVRIVERAQWALAFLEAARADRFAFQVRTQHPGQFLGVSGLMDDDVADRPGFAPGA